MIHRNQELTQDQQNKFQQICRDLGFAHLLDLEDTYVWEICFLYYSNVWQYKPFRIDKGFVKDEYGILKEGCKKSTPRSGKHDFIGYDTDKSVQAIETVLGLTKAQKEARKVQLYDSGNHKFATLDGDLLAAMREAALQHFLMITDDWYNDYAIHHDFNNIDCLEGIYEMEKETNNRMTVIENIAEKLEDTISTLRKYGIFEARNDGHPWPINNNENALLCRWLELVGALVYGDIEGVPGLENEQNRLIRYILAPRD